MNTSKPQLRALLGATLLSLVLLVGLGAGVALADSSPNDTQYANTGATEPTEPSTTTTRAATTTEPAVTDVAGTTSSSEPTTTADEGETLPFTGLNLVVIVALGGAFLLLGLALRRAGRRSTSSDES